MRLDGFGRRAVHRLSIFLGSPGDVAEERHAAQQVVAELLEQPLLKGKISIDLVAWTRDFPLENNADPQHAVAKYVGRPSDCDLTVILLATRLGTPFGRRKRDGSLYRSGTEWELDDARRAKKPVFLYVRRNPSAPSSDEAREQRTALAEFLADLDGARRARNDYDSVAEFQALFREHLLRFVRRKLETVSVLRFGALATVATIAVAATIRAVMPERPTLSVDALDKSYLTSDLGTPQQILLRLKKTVVDARQGDQCLVQASTSNRFSSPPGATLEPNGVVEDAIACEPQETDFLFRLADHRHVEVWSGWVLVALRRGDHIYKSAPVHVEARIEQHAETNKHAPIQSRNDAQ